MLDLKNKKILVTGGAGFLGSHLVEKLVGRGVPKETIFVPHLGEYDLRRREDCEKVVCGQEVVIHLAAKVGGIGFNQEKPGELFYDNMVMGTYMIDAAYRAGAEKMVVLGTICSYPKFTPVPFKEENLWNGYPEETNAPYGLAKKALLIGAQAYREQYGFNVVTLFPVNLYGPRDSFELRRSHVIPALIKKVADAKKEGRNYIDVWGTGRATREFLYVEDAAEAIVLALERYNKPEPVNLGSGHEISIKDLVGLVAKLMDFKGEIRWDPSRPDGQPRRLLDVSRAEHEFDFRAKTNFEEGLKKTIDWYLSNANCAMENGNVKSITACRVCGNKNLASILSLGKLYVSDFLDPNEAEQGIKAPLELVLCKREVGGCGLLQLRHTFPPAKLYGDTYWYRSGINQTMRDALKSITNCVESMAELRPGDYVVDVGSNDSTLLRSYSRPGLNTVGFEPSRNLIPYGEPGVTKLINDFFNADAWEREFPGKKAKVITAIAMFYDLDDPNSFVEDIGRVLSDDGLFVIQQAYLPYMLEKNIIDNTVHEHLEYYSLMSMKALLQRHNMEIFDVELNDVNAGSFRTYIRKKGRGKGIKVLPGAEQRIKELERWEEKLWIDKEKTYKEFAERAEKIKKQVVDFIKAETKKGKKVYVYGASTKGNTLLQYFGLDKSHIVAAAERNKDKWGKVTVGSRIPIVSEEEARAARPDYFLVLPWQFMEEFMKREEEFLARGGKFIVPLPEFRVLGLGDKL